MYEMHRGFTLLELMIVVAIIGILTTVSLPAYQNYSARSKLSEVILALSACRTNITETVQATSSLPLGGQWACESRSGTPVSQYVESVETSDEGAVRARMRNINAAIDGQYVVIRPWPDVNRSGAIQAGDYVSLWVCGPATTNTIDISAMLPTSCRASAADIGATSGWASGS